jgi:hypothetical protein
MTSTLEEVKTVLRQSNARLGFNSGYQEIVDQLLPSERIKAAVKLRVIWLEGQPVKGNFPILILTDQRLLILKINPAGGALKAKTEFEPFNLNQVEGISGYSKGIFELKFQDGATVKGRRIGSWGGMKNTAKFYASLQGGVPNRLKP